MNALALLVSIPSAVVFGFVLGTRHWYPKVLRLSKDNDALRQHDVDLFCDYMESQTNLHLTQVTRDLNATEAQHYFDALVTARKRVVELESMLHGTEEALNYAQEALKNAEIQATRRE